MKKILILYTKAGGGHQSAARAMAAELELRHSCQVQIFDPLEGKKVFFVDNFLEKTYLLLTEKLPWIWALASLLFKYRSFQSLLEWLFWLEVREPVAKKIGEFEPDAAISTYFFFSSVVKKLCVQTGNRLPMLTLVSEIFEAPPIWFTDKDGIYSVFSQRAYDLVVNRYRVDPSKVIVNGLLINKKFDKLLEQSQKEAFRQELAIDGGLPVVLLIGGGAGLPKGYQILQNILNFNCKCHLIMVCGRNQKLKESCAALLQSNKNSDVKVTLLGFSDKVYELLNLADIVITKAGPAIVLETLSLGKVPILCHYIWEQEKGNVDFVVENGLGIYEPDPRKLVLKLSQFLQSPKLLNIYQEAIRQKNIKTDISAATDRIYERLMKF